MATELTAEQWFAILDRIPIALVVVSMDGTIEYFNQRASQTLGYDAEQVPTLADWFPLAYPDPDYRAEVMANWMDQAGRAASTGSDIERREYRVACGDGSVKTMMIFGVIVGSKLCVMFEDMTARHDAEEQRFLRYFEASALGNCTIDFEGRWTLANRALADILGADRRGLVGQSDTERTHPDDRAAVTRGTEELLAGTLDVFTHEKRLRRDDGTYTWVAVSTVLQRDVNGKALQLLAHVQDVNERRRLQASVAQAERMATMGTLAAGVAHEINNPLTFMLFSVERLRDQLARLARDRHSLSQAELDELATRAAEALDGTQRIRSITRALGSFSRIDDEPGPVDLRQPLEHALKTAWNEIRYRARVVKELAEVPAVHAAEGKLSQVFLNLLINAAHAIDEGHVEENELTLRTWSQGDEVFAEVRDTGHGVPAELHERIFEPYFSTKERGKGSGLGLSICRSLIREMGGDIALRSVVGAGSSFVVRLPRRADRTSPQTAPIAPARTDWVGEPGRVLLIDDEPVLRHSLARALRAHQVVALASGAEAKALLETDRAFDVILCDVMMPEVSGPELHAWLSELSPTHAARVVFMTGGAFTGRAAEYLASVQTPRLQKPFDVAEVCELVARAVAEVRGKR